MNKKPARMQPKHGGDPLPLPPIVLPQLEGPARMRLLAAEYVKVLDQELSTVQEGVQKWSGQQLAYIRRVRAKWRMRALGEDPHYLKHGTFKRPPTADPPGMADLWQEQTRRKEELRTGVRVSSAAHRRMQRTPTVHDIVKKWKKQYKATQPKEPED